jgi:hypothetical protein
MLKIHYCWPSVVTFACNPRYSGSRDKGLWFEASLDKKYNETLSQNQWWFMSVIPATWEAEVRGSQSEAASLDKSIRCYLENKQKVKRTGAWLKW